MFFRKCLSYLLLGLAGGSLSISLMAAEGEILNTFASPSSFSSGQAWVKDHLYLLDRGGKIVHKIDPSTGFSVYSFPVTHTGDLTSAYNFIWISDPIKDEIVKIDPVDGQILKTISSPGSAPAGLAHDGSYLWSIDWMENTVYKLNPVDGVVISSFPSPTVGGRPYGLTWDGVYLWMVDWVDDTIYQVNPVDGAVIKSFPAPGTNSQGLAWDGKYLWVSDYDLDTIFKIDSGSDAPGAMGCIEVEGGALSGEIVLSQSGKDDQEQTLIDGCFVYPEITSGFPVTLTITEISTGEDLLAPVITLLGNDDITIELGDTFNDPGSVANDNFDGDISDSIAVTGFVDSLVLGDYVLTYDVTDTAGNQALSVSRTVHVVEEITVIDTVAPVLTLIGSPMLDVTLNESYVDEGAAALDDIDGDLSNIIVVTGSVDTQVVGIYTLSYNVSDAAGNVAETITRTVNVVETGGTGDTEAPVITLVGASSVTVEQGDNYSDAGVTALDSQDGDISNSVVVTGSVDTSKAGTYTLSYNVSDNAGNSALTITRTVIVRDTTAPVLVMQGDSPLTLNVGTSFSDPGAVAYDSIEGNLNASIVATGVVDTSIVGTYTRIYNVSDSSGNAAQPLNRIVYVVEGQDTVAPSISLNGSTPIYVEQGTVFADPGASASDNKDGDISNKIVVTGSVNSNSSGTYIVRYNVSDLAGNKAPEVTRSVIVRDTTNPVIAIKGASTVSVAKNSTYNDAGATAQDNIDGDITSGIITSNNVNTSLVGTYTVIYNVSDNAGNSASQQTRTVNVAFECTEFTSSNSNHESAGRAYSETTGVWFWEKTTWYATGSGVDLGTSGSTTTTLSESSEGYFNSGSCN